MGVPVSFTDFEVDLILQTARDRGTEARRNQRRDFIAKDQDDLTINAFGVRGEWAVAKCLGLNESHVFRNGASFRHDLVLTLGGKDYKLEVKSPLNRNRRLALAQHHTPEKDIQADAYVIVWPLWEIPNHIPKLDALYDPVELMGFVPRKLFQKKGQWITLHDKPQWCLDPKHFRRVRDLPIDKYNVWPEEMENPYEKVSK